MENPGHFSVEINRVTLLDLCQKLCGTDPINGGGLDKGCIEGFKVYSRMNVHTAAPRRANKSETFDGLKFTLEGSGERSDGNARTSAHTLACRA
jgi:hypothetical protein